MDAESGRILYGKEEQTPRPMASTTKIMTCLLALEQSSPSEEVSFSSRAVSMPKVHLGASKGSSFAMNDLLHSLCWNPTMTRQSLLPNILAARLKALPIK